MLGAPQAPARLVTERRGELANVLGLWPCLIVAIGKEKALAGINQAGLLFGASRGNRTLLCAAWKAGDTTRVLECEMDAPAGFEPATFRL